MSKDEIKEGKIVDFKGSWGSGICILQVQDKGGKIHSIPCDNAPTVRALDSAFGNVISSGHSVDVAKLRGKKIRYAMTDWGTMAGFEPVYEDE